MWQKIMIIFKGIKNKGSLQENEEAFMTTFELLY